MKPLTWGPRMEATNENHINDNHEWGPQMKPLKKGPWMEAANDDHYHKRIFAITPLRLPMMW